MIDLRERFSDYSVVAPAALGFIAVGAVSVIEHSQFGEAFSGSGVTTLVTLGVLNRLSQRSVSPEDQGNEFWEE